MLRSRRRLASFAAALSVALLSAAVLVLPARAQSGADDAEALMREGTELRRRGEDARALPLFERAYRLARSPRTTAQLGLVKMALGYWADGERLLDEALATRDHPWIVRNLKTLEEARASARKNVGELAVDGGPPGAEVLVNERLVGTLPLAAPIRLDRGPLDVQVRAPGHVPFSQSLKLAGGARETLSVTLARSGAPASAGTGVAAEPRTAAAVLAPGTVGVAPRDDGGPAAAGRPLRPLAWTAGALAAASLTLAIVETAVATSRIDEFNAHSAPDPTPDDPGRRAPDCETVQLSDQCRALRDASERAKTLAIAGYIGAGVFAATSATLFVLSNRPEASARHATAAAGLLCAPALPAPGVTCRLAF